MSYVYNMKGENSNKTSGHLTSGGWPKKMFVYLFVCFEPCAMNSNKSNTHVFMFVFCMGWYVCVRVCVSEWDSFALEIVIEVGM